MKVIGIITRLTDMTEHPYLAGYDVKIRGVLWKALVEDEPRFLSTDREIALAGGVTALDRVEVAPIMENGRVSFVSSDPRAIDLECFAHLRRTDKPPQ